MTIAAERDDVRDTYSVTFTGLLLDQSPEALTAAMQLAFLEIRSWRQLCANGTTDHPPIRPVGWRRQ